MPSSRKSLDTELVRHLLFQKSDWEEVLKLTKSTLVENPSDLSARILLISLLFFDNDFKRVEQQLKAYFSLNGENFSADYFSILSALQTRVRVFKGETKPHFLGNEPEWFERYQYFFKLGIEKSSEELSELTESLLTNLLQQEYSFAGENTVGLANYDTRLPGVIEGVFEGEYTWLCLEEIESIELPEKPELLLDYVALPAQVTVHGKERRGFVLPLYFGSHESTDMEVKIGRGTSWNEEEEINIGKGVQLFACGDKTLSIFDLKNIQSL